MNETDALRTIHTLAALGSYVIGAHAHDRMDERGVSAKDLRNALKHAKRTTLQPNGRWKTVGPDLDGEELTMAVVIRNNLFIVTVY